MFRTKPSRTERLKAHVVEAREQAAPLATETVERVRDAWEEAKDRAAPAMADLGERARPKVEAAQSTLVETVLPKMGAVLGAAAGAFSEGADQARERVREAAEPQMERARGGAHASSERVRDAYRVLSGEAVAKPKRGKGTWLVLIGLVAAAFAGLAAYRKQQQVNDPWATPYGEGTLTPVNGSLKDRAASTVESAKEAVSDAASKAKDAAAELAAKGQSALADAKDRSGESVDEAEMEAVSMRTDAALDESLAGAPTTPSGQVTSVDPLPDSDAITSDAVDGGTVVPKGGAKGARKGKLT